MAPRICCCGTDCNLGEDEFVRVDSSDPGPLWKIISGTGAIVDNAIVVSGRVATRICHPAGHDNGSYSALFELVNCRTVSLFEVGVGDPNTSSYAVKFEPIGVDTFAAKIKVTVIGTTTEVFEYPWPAGFDGLSSNILAVSVCYEPGALLRGSLLPPTVDVCIPGPGAACYTSGGEDVGGFFWKEGTFRNWIYRETILDNWDCVPCGCFCIRRSGDDREFSCFPRTLHLNLNVTTGSCPELDGLVIALHQGNLSPTDGYTQKIRWLSDLNTCGGFTWGFVAECSGESREGTSWLSALSLKIVGSLYTVSTVLFQWTVPTDGGATRNADFEASTCDPLSLVYPGLKVNSFVGPCPPRGMPGYFLFCCSAAGCSPVPLDVQIEAIITL